MKELEGIVEVGLPSWACFFAPGLSKLPLGALEYTPAAPVQSTFGVCVCGPGFLVAADWRGRYWVFCFVFSTSRIWPRSTVLPFW